MYLIMVYRVKDSYTGVTMYDQHVWWNSRERGLLLCYSYRTIQYGDMDGCFSRVVVVVLVWWWWVRIRGYFYLVVTLVGLSLSLSVLVCICKVVHGIFLFSTCPLCSYIMFIMDDGQVVLTVEYPCMGFPIYTLFCLCSVVLYTKYTFIYVQIFLVV